MSSTRLIAFSLLLLMLVCFACSGDGDLTCPDAPSIVLVAEPETADTGESVTFTLAASAPGHTISGSRIDCDDDGTWDDTQVHAGSAIATTYGHAYDTAEVYLARAEVLEGAVVLASATVGIEVSEGVPQVTLSVLSLDSPPVTATETTPTQGTCQPGGTLCDSTADCPVNEVCVLSKLCIFEVMEWSAILGATAQSTLAVGPSNDVIMDQVTISYSWPGTTFTTPPRTFGLGGVSIPADGSNSVSFVPILGQDLQLLDQGVTGNLTMTFHGRTVAGSELSTTAQAVIYIESCGD